MELSYLRRQFELQLEASVSERTNTHTQPVLTIWTVGMGMQVGNAGEVLGMALNLEQNAVGAMIFTIAIDAIINQKDCLCVYVAVGQKASTLAQIASTLGQHDSLATTVLVMSGADDPATLQFVLTIGDGIARVAGMQECMSASDAITSLVTAPFEGMQQVAGQR